jgi:hypothetical protein
MSEVIDFARAKADADKSRSTLFVSLDVYLNADNSEVWASVTNIDEQDIDGSWHTFVADLLRKLAWLSDGMASERDATIGQPVANIALFADSRISTRWDENIVQTHEQVEWIQKQSQSGVDEIETHCAVLAELEGGE